MNATLIRPDTMPEQTPSLTKRPASPGPSPGWRAALGLVARGVLMGAADAVPGVSGGTVALVTGVYPRLVLALSRFDRRWLALLAQRQWRRAYWHVDGGFLFWLAAGIGMGWLGLAKLMSYLVGHYRLETMSVFLGMIAASTWVVWRTVPRWTLSVWCAALIGAGVGLWLPGPSGLPLQPSHLPPEPWYVVLASAVAICAMILPGVSGMSLLVLLGLYESVVGSVHRITSCSASAEDWQLMILFAVGAAGGLLGFVKLLRWLLHHHKGVTMATLLGLMLGSLRGLWPLGYGATVQQWAWALALAATGFAAVVALEWLALGRKASRH